MAHLRKHDGLPRGGARPVGVGVCQEEGRAQLGLLCGLTHL
jgi:hypothetical protein